MANFYLRKAEPKDVPDILRLIKVTLDFTLVQLHVYIWRTLFSVAEYVVEL